MKNIALITGSSNGIGAGTAKVLAKNNFDVVVTYFQNQNDGEKIVEEILQNGGSAKLIHLDVTNEESVKKAFEFIESSFGKLDLLINNAAADWPINIEENCFEDWKTITRTKIDGNFLCTKYAIPLLKKSENPNIIILASNMFERVDPTDPAYSSGTGATISFMYCMALSLAKYKIRTNCVNPTTTRTPMWKHFGGENEEMWENFAKNNPLGRISTPEDVEKTILMIFNDETRYLNGNMIYVTGGNHLK